MQHSEKKKKKYENEVRIREKNVKLEELEGERVKKTKDILKKLENAETRKASLEVIILIFNRINSLKSLNF